MPFGDGSPSDTWSPVISLSPSFWNPVVLRQARVDGGRRIAPLGEDPNRLVCRIREVEAHVEQVRGVEGVALGVKSVARVLDHDEVVPGPEGEVVEARVRDVAEEEERQGAVVVGRPALRELEERAEAAEVAPRLGLRVRVTRLGEVELAEVGAGTEHAVLWSLERRAPLVLSEPVGVERSAAVHRGVVNGDPARVEDQTIRVEVADVL